MSWKRLKTVVKVASLSVSWAWTFATTHVVWGVVELAKNLSNTLFCTFSIIGGHVIGVAVSL